MQSNMRVGNMPVEAADLPDRVNLSPHLVDGIIDANDEWLAYCGEMVEVATTCGRTEWYASPHRPPGWVGRPPIRVRVAQGFPAVLLSFPGREKHVEVAGWAGSFYDCRGERLVPRVVQVEVPLEAIEHLQLHMMNDEEESYFVRRAARYTGAAAVFESTKECLEAFLDDLAMNAGLHGPPESGSRTFDAAVSVFHCVDEALAGLDGSTPARLDGPSPRYRARRDRWLRGVRRELHATHPLDWVHRDAMRRAMDVPANFIPVCPTRVADFAWSVLRDVPKHRRAHPDVRHLVISGAIELLLRATPPAGRLPVRRRLEMLANASPRHYGVIVDDIAVHERPHGLLA